MSHSLSVLAGTIPVPLTLTIINYAVGGEVVALSELGATGLSGVLFGTVPSNANSLGVPLIATLVSGKVMLFRFVAGAPAEIPATTALNAVIPALAYVTKDPTAASIYP